jgi:hypothetical protein
MTGTLRLWRALRACGLGAAFGCAMMLMLGGGQDSRIQLQAAGTEAVPFSADYYTSSSQRFGVGLNNGITVPVAAGARPVVITDYDVAALHVGWYSDWATTQEPLRPGGIRYAQLVQVRASKYPTNTLDLTATVEADSGALWLIGNEPEAKYNQGNRTPVEYAQIYHDVYGLIKRADPSAWVAIGGVVEPTPLRLQWLGETLAAYESLYGATMPVDVWNIHVQILQERAGDWGAEIPAGIDATTGELFSFSTETGYYDNANPALFRQLVTQFRQWMKDRGLQEKPLIISEYGVLLPSNYIGYGDGYGDIEFGDRVLETFMRETFEFLVTARDPQLGYPADDYRLVQQWLWYSLNDQPFGYDPDTGRQYGFNGALFDHTDPTRMTQFGQTFRDYVRVLLGYPRMLLPIVVQRGSDQGFGRG